MSSYSRLLLLIAGLGARPLTAQTPPCPEPDSTAPWVRVGRAWSDETHAHWSDDSLRRVLLAMRDRDQAARADFGARVTDSSYLRQLMATDSVIGSQMGEILDRFGLPSRAVVGPEGVSAAMLIVQHNWPLQERVLALATAARAGSVSPEALAMLEDRVRVHQGKAQRFGTQFNAGPDGLFRLALTDDLDGLAARRAAAGLPPLPLYVCYLEQAGMRVDRRSIPATALR